MPTGVAVAAPVDAVTPPVESVLADGWVAGAVLAVRWMGTAEADPSLAKATAPPTVTTLATATDAAGSTIRRVTTRRDNARVLVGAESACRPCARVDAPVPAGTARGTDRGATR
ncbi:hypothetical protein [Pseudofrankia inefficax]|uniref:hypothetical protein n=1 Tax=Pseudofrankia inefficax (strain DSM 45817 / CECT 9037 / DDB 130130 / EuI1c) TaxID=298654 RepID=UPI0002E0097E|nr:hypothetical protein [Pseudofrankia inefficax]